MAAHNLTSTVQPSDVYGGDEVQAFVLDPGYYFTRAGFAGEDAPKAVQPSFYARINGADQPKDIYGEQYLIPRENLEVRNYMTKDSIVEDWDTAPKFWESLIRNQLLPPRQVAPKQNGLNDIPREDQEGDVEMGDSNGADKTGDTAEDEELKLFEESPLLMTEAPWNTTKNREKSIEMAMEGWGCPAFWISRTPTLVSFAAGKPTALIIDVGAANASVVAVHDGHVLKRSIQKSPVGGLWLSQQVQALWEGNDPKVEPVPFFMVENKAPVDAGAPAQYTARKLGFDISETFRAYEDERLRTEFKESVVEVWRGPTRFMMPGTEEIARNQTPGRVFEFPDGSNHMWRETRYRVAEGMWDDTAQLPNTPDEWKISAEQTLSSLIRNCLSGVDVDLRPNLLGNVVVTGASTLINGFNDRLNIELTQMFPGLKIRIHSAGLSSERRFGAWVGGSILSSLGTFHQMWISRKEYEENGVNIVEKRCK
ncbi:Actin-related protein 4 [Zalerion maritima]|uniref:Actin-related protein 4 n=1 Tax=Zalerion maritima TaxID=339359 RepID=A0AAD5RY40_9PEZI|nr:Actin-related protein 4 [Zalerion maritima]